ncbi:MAG: DUF4177 domain-containing protein [Pseudomonadota bacterium]
MDLYEYRVVPAPTRALRWKGVRGVTGRFARTIEAVINDFGADGWEYLRADMLPMEKRRLLSGPETILQNVLVFRRTKIAEDSEVVVEAAPAPVEDIAQLDDSDAIDQTDSDVAAFADADAFAIAPLEPTNSAAEPEENDAFRRAIASIALGGQGIQSGQQTAVAPQEPQVLAQPVIETEVVASTPASVENVVVEEPTLPPVRSTRVNPALAARAARLTANRTAAE